MHNRLQVAEPHRLIRHNAPASTPNVIVPHTVLP